jgi:hypothetical protein
MLSCVAREEERSPFQILIIANAPEKNGPYQYFLFRGGVALKSVALT